MTDRPYEVGVLDKRSNITQTFRVNLMRCATLAFLIWIGMITLSIASSGADVVSTLIKPQVGDTVYYRIRETTSFGSQPSSEMPIGLSEISIEYLGEILKGHRYRVSFLSYKVENKENLYSSFWEQDHAIFQDLVLTYLADEKGVPLAIQDLQKVKDHILSSLSAAPTHQDEPLKALQGFYMRFIGRLTVDRATGLLLKDIRTLTKYSGSDFSMNTPYIETRPSKQKRYGTIMEEQIITKVLSVHEGVVKLQTRSSYTPDSVTAALTPMVEFSFPPKDFLGTAKHVEEKEKNFLRRKERYAEGLRKNGMFDMRRDYDTDISILDGWPVRMRFVSSNGAGDMKYSSTVVFTRLDTAPN